MRSYRGGGISTGPRAVGGMGTDSGEGRGHGAHKGQNLFRAGEVRVSMASAAPVGFLSLRQTEIRD